ncbi:MAG: extracellular solute-binding protein [Pirellulales bacterium]
MAITACWMLLASAEGCGNADSEPPAPTANEVVVYTALDREFSEALLDDFTGETGVEALPKFDTESTKSVGLAEAISREAARPRADVYWNNEILNTLRLARAGLLEPYVPTRGAEFPQQYRSPDGLWHGFAARARVLIVNTDLVPNEEFPDSIHDLTDPKWAGRAAMAKPLFGTTATHAACLFAQWGDERAKDFFRAAKANGVQIMSGNKRVAQSVAGGTAAFGLTDTDDAMVEIEKGMPVAIVYPDQQPRGDDEALGTLFIPNTLAIIRGGPNPQAARRLVDWLLTPEIEGRLAAGPSAQIPLHPDATAKPRVETPATVRAMSVDFERAAESWESARTFIRDEFAG